MNGGFAMMAPVKNGSIGHRTAYVAIILFGIVSLMGDTVYEGARGLVPDYLYYLGATALVVGLVSGLGELLGYVVRLVSGEMADRTQAYWFFIFLGYGLIVAIPLLAFAWTWEIAVILVLLERLGKGLRAPSRDTVLSIVSKGVGPGKAFGIHELLDQVGAVLGPLLVAIIMLNSLNDYRLSFTFLLLPFLLLVVALTVTRNRIRVVAPPKEDRPEEEHKALGKEFYTYTLAVVLNTVGLIPAALILFRASSLLQPENLQWLVPVIYVIIQGVDAIVAPIAGYSYDRFGLKIMAVPFLLSIFPPLFVSAATGLEYLIVASIFFGLVLGMQESTYRAAVTKFAPIQSRGRAYGIFNTAYGVAFLVSGVSYGLLLDLKAPFVLILLFVIVLQTLAVVVLPRTSSEARETPEFAV